MATQPTTAGDLRDRVAWYAPVRTRGDTGQAVVTFPEACGPYAAKVLPVTQAAGEREQHRQQTPGRRYEITLRSRTVPGLAADWRAVWANRSLTLEVRAVLPHPNGDEWVLVLAHELPASTG